MEVKMKLYQSNASPNSRRVRIYLAEKGISMPIVPVDLGAKEQFSDAYADFNASLADVRFIAGEDFSVADITAVVTVDFATKAAGLPITAEHTALKRWYDAVSARASIGA